MFANNTLLLQNLVQPSTMQKIYSKVHTTLKHKTILKLYKKYIAMYIKLRITITMYGREC